MGPSQPPGDFISRIMTVDAVIAAFAGACLYFLPQNAADYVFKRETDGVHWHLVRCVGGQLIASSFISLRLKHNQLERTILFLVRFISSIVILMLIWQSQSQTPSLIQPHVLEAFKYGNIASLVVFLLLWLYSGCQIGDGSISGSKVGNFLYQVDSLICILIGAAWITFPKWLLHRQVKVELDESHEFVGRCMGAFFLAFHVVAQHALHWPADKDRKLVIEFRVVIAYGRDWSGNHWVGISLFSSWTFAAFAYKVALLLSSKQKSKKNN